MTVAVPFAGPLAAGCGTAAAGAGVGGAPLDTAAAGAAVAAAGAPISWRATAAKAHTTGPPTGATGLPPENRLATDRIVASNPDAALATAPAGAATACGATGTTLSVTAAGETTEVSVASVAEAVGVTALTAGTVAVAEGAICCSDNTPPAWPVSRPPERPAVVEMLTSVGEAEAAGGEDAAGDAAWLLPTLPSGGTACRTPLSSCRDALLAVALPEVVGLSPTEDPARVVFVLPADGAPSAAESSACAIPALPPTRAAPIPTVNAAGPSHE